MSIHKEATGVPVETRNIESILGEFEVMLCVSYNRYGGGFVATLASCQRVSVIDDIFANSDSQNYLGTTLMRQLGLPYVVGTDPRKIIDELLSESTVFVKDEFGHKFRRLAEAAESFPDNYRQIEDGSFAKRVVEEWKNQDWED